MKKLFGLVCLMFVLQFAMTVVVTSKIDNRLTALEQDNGSPPVTAMVTTTMYNAVVSQCDNDPLVTAANYTINPQKASEHKYVALSRNLLKRWNGQFDYGDRIRISGTDNKDGVYIVADTMNKRFTNCMDILETSGVGWYKYTDVQITKLNS